MGNPANLFRTLAFAILGAIVGYFVLTHITFVRHHIEFFGGFEKVRIVNAILGIVLFSFCSQKPKERFYLLIGGLIGAFLSTVFSPIIASIFTDLIWYSIFDKPVLTDNIFKPTLTIFWVIFVIIGIKIAIKINKKRTSAK